MNDNGIEYGSRSDERERFKRVRDWKERTNGIIIVNTREKRREENRDPTLFAIFENVELMRRGICR